MISSSAAGMAPRTAWRKASRSNRRLAMKSVAGTACEDSRRRQEGRLGAHGAPAEIGQEISLAEQRLGAALVEDDAGVGGGSHLERDLAAKVGFDDAGHGGSVGPLGRQDHVDAGGPRF